MIKLFYIDLEQECTEKQKELFGDALVDERKQRVSRLKNEKLAHKQMLAGIFLQYILSEQLGVLIFELVYSYGKWGKPELDYEKMNQNLGKNISKLYFNLSHSGRYAVCAVSDYPIGIDLEKKVDKNHTIARRFFHENEVRVLEQINGENIANRTFLEYWTMKEACVKQVGKGLQIPLDSFWIQTFANGMHVTDLVINEKTKRLWFASAYLKNTQYMLSVCSDSESEIFDLCEKSGWNPEKTDMQAFDICEISFDQIEKACTANR